jgi:1-acyl-sn-glycerol-3-phosphate acyltransferase
MKSFSPFQTVDMFVRSAVFAILFYGLTPLTLIASVIVSPLGFRYVTPVAEFWSRMHRFLARWILRQKVVVIGELPKEPVFIASKHESMFETLDAILLFKRPVIAAKQELARIPVWGFVARAYGLMIVDRQGGASALRGIRAEARAAVENGRLVLLYPEGTRVAPGARPELRAGFAGLYKGLNLPVLPVAVNSGLVSPRRSFIKRPGTITYLFGEIIPAGLPRREAEARVHAAINALNPPPSPSADSV